RLLPLSLDNNLTTVGSIRNASHQNNCLRVLWSAFVVDAGGNGPSSVNDNDNVNNSTDNDNFAGFVVSDGNRNNNNRNEHGNEDGNDNNGCLDSAVALSRVIEVVDSIDDVTNAGVLERFRTFAVCNSCKDSMIRGVVPAMCVAYGYKYPSRPVGLPELNAVEERLISPRLPFMSIRRLTRATGQYGILGQVVNVPIEVPKLVLELPRQVPDDAAIDVNIKRRLMSPATYK
ncbi:uncharacterized protein LOC144158104, partial [Haemaphysalis longicornis]